MACGYNPEMAGQIKVAAALHDVGKSKISKQILEKPNELTTEEFNAMKLHTVYGANILTSVPGELGEMAKQIALLHHEKWDGTGYWGYKASCLPRFIGVVSICDVALALVSERPYKRPWPLDETLRYIAKQAGIQFCPELVGIFFTLIHGNDGITNILLCETAI